MVFQKPSNASFKQFFQIHKFWRFCFAAQKTQTKVKILLTFRTRESPKNPFPQNANDKAYKRSFCVFNNLSTLKVEPVYHDIISATVLQLCKRSRIVMSENEIYYLISGLRLVVYCPPPSSIAAAPLPSN